jgi:hypothetical protein
VIVCDEIKYIYIYNDCGGLVLCFCSGQRGCGCRPTSGGGGGTPAFALRSKGKTAEKASDGVWHWAVVCWVVRLCFGDVWLWL